MKPQMMTQSKAIYQIQIKTYLKTYGFIQHPDLSLNQIHQPQRTCYVVQTDQLAYLQMWKEGVHSA